MITPGDVVTLPFPGVRDVKRRPAVVVSSTDFHQTRTDVIAALLTSQLREETAPTDYLLADWAAAGLRRPSLFRVFLTTQPASVVTVIGHLSERDWREVQARLHLGLAIA